MNSDDKWRLSQRGRRKNVNIDRTFSIAMPSPSYEELPRTRRVWTASFHAAILTAVKPPTPSLTKSRLQTCRSHLYTLQDIKCLMFQTKINLCFCAQAAHSFVPIKITFTVTKSYIVKKGVLETLLQELRADPFLLQREYAPTHKFWSSQSPNLIRCLWNERKCRLWAEPYRPAFCSQTRFCGWMGANPCSQVPNSGGENSQDRGSVFWVFNLCNVCMSTQVQMRKGLKGRTTSCLVHSCWGEL